MSFYGYTSMFDGIPSETYDLFISSPDGGEVEVPAANDVTLLTETVWRRSVPYLYGVKQEPTLQFEVSFNSMNELTAIDSSLIGKWLFGQTQYKRLQIIQPDMDQVYFNCFLKNPRLHKVGNRIYGYRATVICDAPWAWEVDKTKTWTWTQELVTEWLQFDDSLYGDFGGIFPETQPCFFNTGDNNDYIYPQLEFIMNAYGGGFCLTA